MCERKYIFPYTENEDAVSPFWDQVIPDDDFDGGLEGSPYKIFEKEFADMDDPSMFMCAGCFGTGASTSAIIFWCRVSEISVCHFEVFLAARSPVKRLSYQPTILS